MGQKTDIIIVGGTDHTEVFSILKEGAPFNATGAEIELLVKSEPYKEEFLIQHNVANGKIQISSDGFNVTMKLNHVETKQLTPSIAFYTLRLTDNLGDIYQLYSGRMRFE